MPAIFYAPSHKPRSLITETPLSNDKMRHSSFISDASPNRRFPIHLRSIPAGMTNGWRERSGRFPARSRCLPRNSARFWKVIIRRWGNPGGNIQILTAGLATVYELPTVVSRGDFHIFMNTALFGAGKYVARFDVAQPRRRNGRERVPNLLVRLFVHWSREVRGYLHQVLVWRVAIRWAMGRGFTVETRRGPRCCSECS